MEKLKKGDKAPDFVLSDQNGVRVRRSDFAGKKLLVYFYPKAGTSGCTVQTEAVRDAQEELAAAGVAVVGISPDSEKSQKKFAGKLSVSFPLLSDTEHTAAEAYGVWGEKTMCGKKYFGIIRSSFLIDEQGKVVDAWYKVTPADTVPKAKKALGLSS
ncbi:MAG: thioredoxin-dependent thiol peroxidase [Desulfomonilia bacterium]|nr:thioredoxin-dependent thiol peroxidase [Desulfomonilia bacterium]